MAFNCMTIYFFFRAYIYIIHIRMELNAIKITWTRQRRSFAHDIKLEIAYDKCRWRTQQIDMSESRKKKLPTTSATNNCVYCTPFVDIFFPAQIGWWHVDAEYCDQISGEKTRKGAHLQKKSNERRQKTTCSIAVNYR